MPDQTASTDEVASFAAKFEKEVRDLLPKLKVGPSLSPSYADAILVHRRIGEIVLKYVPEGVGGDTLFEALATTVGHHGPWIRRLRTFVLEYTKTEMERLIRRAPKITFSHVIQLLYIHDKKLRNQLEKSLGEKQWTPAQLSAEIKTAMGGPRRKGGRSIQFPSEIAAGLKKMLEDVRSIDRRWQDWRVRLVESPQLKLPETKASLIELVQTLRKLSASIRKLTGK
jgi:hypothetical protein